MARGDSISRPFGGTALFRVLESHWSLPHLACRHQVWATFWSVPAFEGRTCRFAPLLARRVIDGGFGRVEVLLPMSGMANEP